MYYLLVLLSFVFALTINKTYADTNEIFKTGIKAFQNHEFEKADKYLSQIKPQQIIYPYALYYLITIKEIENKNINIPKDLQKYKNLAIYSYINLKLSSFYLNKNQPKKAYHFLKKIHQNKIDKKDIPFYLYLKAQILDKLNQKKKSLKIKKILAVRYTYDKFYGFLTFLEIKNQLNNWEKYKSIDNLISYRKFNRAHYLLKYLPESDKKIYYNLYLLTKLNKLVQAENLLSKLDKKSKFFNRALYILAIANYKNYTKQKIYFDMITNPYYKEKLAFYLMKKNFYKNNTGYFFFYSLFIHPDSKYYGDKLWLKTLYFYRIKRYQKSYKILKKSEKYFYEKSKYYYWMYKLAKKLNKNKEAYEYLKKIQKLTENITFYKVLAYEKLRKYTKRNIVKLVSYHIPNSTKQVKLPSELLLIKLLRSHKKLYKWAFLEGKLYKDKESLYSVMPEITARKFGLSEKNYLKSYPKPFGTGFSNKLLQKKFESLVYSIMRQESFFNPYAISVSNAIGLMQFIPSTATWVANNLKMEKFDLTDLFTPENNVKFGKWYLNYLLEKWNGNIYYTIASYNAGQGAVKRFLENQQAYNYSIEEFAEYFPYEETRNYIKKVYRNFVVYNLIYKQK